jgi:hypothetical protein
MNEWVLLPCGLQWSGKKFVWDCPVTEGDGLSRSHSHWMRTSDRSLHITHHRLVDSDFERPNPDQVGPSSTHAI